MTDYQFITPVQFLGMIKSGARHIIQSERILNQLNVFPVTDHDTGTNLASLMRYVSSQIYAESRLKTLIDQLQEAFLYGASGNSGMIFSSFFSGFGSHPALDNETAFSLPLFSECLQLGKQHAYQAVEEPVEGTMLSIFNVWANAYSPRLPDFNAFFSHCTTLAKEALSKTEFQLSVLKDNHVIDAGAMGVQLFIQGMYDYLRNPEEYLKTEENAEIASPLHKEVYQDSHEVESTFTYCMETITYQHQQPHTTAELKTTLHAHGDSIVISETGTHQKIHIHTNEPEQITNLLNAHANIQYQKVDNMKLQWATSHARKYPIAIVTDSTADLPKEWVNQEQIHIIPIQIKKGQDNLLDGVTISLSSLFQFMDSSTTPVTTASPSPLIISRQYQYLLTKYDSIIVVSLAAKLSSTYQVFAQEAMKINQDAISVVDSTRNSAAQGILVMAAAKWVKEGLTHSAIVEKLLALRKNLPIFLLTNDLMPIARSGRLPEILGKLSHFSNIKPILTLNEIGKPILAGVSLGEGAAWKKTLKLLEKANSEKQYPEAIIVHTEAPEKAEAFAKYLTEKMGIKVAYILPSSAAYGVHLGRGCLSVALSPIKLE